MHGLGMEAALGVLEWEREHLEPEQEIGLLEMLDKSILTQSRAYLLHFGEFHSTPDGACLIRNPVA